MYKRFVVFTLSLCFITSINFFAQKTNPYVRNILPRNAKQNLKEFILKNFLPHAKTSAKKNNPVKQLDSLLVLFRNNLLTKLEFTYNGKGQITSVLFSNVDENPESPYYKIQFSYDTLKNAVKREEYSLHADWTPELSETVYYNKDGDKYKSVSQIWQEGNWKNLLSFEVFFESAGRDTASVDYSWNGAEWAPECRYINTFDENGRKAAARFEEFNGADWDKKILQNFKYDDMGRRKEVLNLKWNGTGWENYADVIVNYEGLKMTELLQMWGGAAFFDDTRLITITDNDGYVVEGFGETKNYDVWQPEVEDLAIYNPDGFEIHFMALGINAYYKKPDGVKAENPVLVNNMNLLRNYPNPFNPSTVIKYNVGAAGNVTLAVYDGLGREIKKLVNEYKTAGNYSVSFNAAGLPSGFYFARLTAGGKSIVNKMLLIK